MTHRISIRPAAARDIAAARSWYDGEREGLGAEFLDEIEATMGRIGKTPEGYSVAHADARRALLRRFPYAIYFRIAGQEVRIVAVVHQSRDPRFWQQRVRE